MPESKQPGPLTAENYKALIREELAILEANTVFDPNSGKLITPAGPLHGDQVKILREILEDKDNFAALCNTLQQEYKHYEGSPDFKQWISHDLRTRIDTLKSIGISSRLKSRNQVKLALEQIGIYAGIQQEAEELAESIVNGNTKLLALFRKTEAERAKFLANPIGVQKVLAIKFVSEILQNETRNLSTLHKIRDLKQRYNLFKPILDEYERGNHDIVKLIGKENTPGIKLSRNQLEEAFNTTYDKKLKIKGKLEKIEGQLIPRLIPPGKITFMNDIRETVENEKLATLVASETKKVEQDTSSLAYKINAAYETGALSADEKKRLKEAIKILGKSNINDIRTKIKNEPAIVSRTKELLRKANLLDAPVQTSMLLPRDIIAGKILTENLLRKKYLELGGDKSPWPAKNIPALYFLENHWNAIINAYSQQTDVRSNVTNLLSKLPGHLAQAAKEAYVQEQLYPQQLIRGKTEVTNPIAEFFQKQTGFAKHMQELTKLHSGLQSKDPKDQFVMDFLISPFLRLSDDQTANPFGEPTATSSILGRAASIANKASDTASLIKSLENFRDCGVNHPYLNGFINQHFGDDEDLIPFKSQIDSLTVEPYSKTAAKYEDLLKDIIKWFDDNTKNGELKKADGTTVKVPKELLSEIKHLGEYIHNKIRVFQLDQTYETLEQNFCQFVSRKLAEKKITITSKKDDLVDLYFTLKQERTHSPNKKTLDEFIGHVEHFFKQTIVHDPRLLNTLLDDQRFTNALFNDKQFKEAVNKNGRFSNHNLNDSKSRKNLLQDSSFRQFLQSDEHVKTAVNKYISSLKPEVIFLTIDKASASEIQERQQKLSDNFDHLLNQIVVRDPPLLSTLLNDHLLIDALLNDSMFQQNIAENIKLKNLDLKDPAIQLSLPGNKDFIALVASSESANNVIGQYLKSMKPDLVNLQNKKDPILLKLEIVRQLTNTHEGAPDANPQIKEDLRSIETQLKTLQVLSTSPAFEMTHSLSRFDPLSHENVSNAQATLKKTELELIRLQQHYIKSATAESAALPAKHATTEEKKAKPLYFFKKPSREQEKIKEWLQEHPSQATGKGKK